MNTEQGATAVAIAVTPGMHLRAGEAIYRVEAIDDDYADLMVITGSKTLAGKIIPWPLSNLIANLELGYLAVIDAPDAAGAVRAALL